MTLSMYKASVPVFISGFNNLSAILKKAESYCEAKKIDPTVLINSRIAPDMLPLSKQVQIASDMTKGAAARLAGVEPPSFPDTESSFAELQSRIAKTVAFLTPLKAAQIDGTEDKSITLKVGGNDLQFKGQDYLLGFVIPNFYFHVSIAYAILRHNGLDIGKKDFLGATDTAKKAA